MTVKKGKTYVGISGFRYPEFRGVFYPKGLKAKDELAYAASKFASIELNGSFYSLLRPELYASFRGSTPAGFLFAVKGPRYITHILKLREVEAPLANFFASGVLGLAEKLGPVLWQFPENMPHESGRFARFFSLLPRDTLAAAALARKHDAWLEGRVAFGDGVRRSLRHAVEVRNPAFATVDFIELLRREKIALVVADTGGRFPLLEDVTADFVYVRLHGDQELYASGYSSRALAAWARRVDAWRRGREPEDAARVSLEAAPKTARDVYVYFDNDAEVHAPFDAMLLARMLESETPRATRRRAETRPH